MKNISKLKLLLYAVIASLPVGIPIIFDMWSGLGLPHTPIGNRIVLAIGWIGFNVFLIKRVIHQESLDYHRQLSQKFLHRTQNTLTIWNFVGYALSFVGTLLIIFYTCEYIGFDPGAKFGAAGGLGIFIAMLCIVSLHISWTLYPTNYTGYIIDTIRLCEYKVSGSGSKELRLPVGIMFYGDKNSPENLQILNNTIAYHVPLLRVKLAKEHADQTELQALITSRNEEAFDNDPWRDLKSKLQIRAI